MLGSVDLGQAAAQPGGLLVLAGGVLGGAGGQQFPQKAGAFGAEDAFVEDRFLRTYNASILSGWRQLSNRLGATIIDRLDARTDEPVLDPSREDEAAADSTVSRWHRRLSVVRDKQPEE